MLKKKKDVVNLHRKHREDKSKTDYFRKNMQEVAP
jgi:hypothetical protein